MGHGGQQRTVVDWGAAAPAAPSTKRVDALGWLVNSAILGSACGLGALAAAWLPLLGFDPPPGALGFHVAHAAKWCVHAALPHWFVADASAYGALAPGAWLARSALAPHDGLIPLRGAKRFEGRQASEALRAAFARRAKARPDHPIAPGVPFPSDMWARHVLLVAGTGAGKSTCLRPLIAKVVQSGESLLLFDPKGEFTKAFAEPGIMAPWDARSLCWDIAKDLRNVGDMRRFAGAMIREAQDPMWSNSARQLLVGFLIYLKSTRGEDWGWRELADVMATPQAGVLSIMSAHHPEASSSTSRRSPPPFSIWPRRGATLPRANASASWNGRIRPASADKSSCRAMALIPTSPRAISKGSSAWWPRSSTAWRWTTTRRANCG
jgi:hypothetical protein